MSKVRGIGYIRFSTKEQGAEGKRSYDRQWEKIKNYAAKQGLELDSEPYFDEGISSFKGANKKASLGELQRKAGTDEIPKGSVVITESMDRLGRESPLDQIIFIKALVDTGVKLAVLDTSKLYDENSLHDVMELMFAVMSAGRGHQESQAKSDRISDVWEKRRKDAEKGIITSGNLPCWLKREDKKAVLIPERAELIKRMFEMSAYEDMGVYAIRNTLNADPKTPYWGSPSRVNTRDAHVWRHSFITRVLKDMSVLGWWQPYERLENGKRKKVGEPIKQAYPPIVDEGLFHLVQTKMAQRYIKGESGRKGKNLYSNLLRKVGFCPCGARLHFEQKGRSKSDKVGGKPIYRYLTCFEQCGRKHVNYGIAEDLIINSLHSVDLRSVIFGQNQERERLLNANAEIEATIDSYSVRYDSLSEKHALSGDEDESEILMESMLRLKKEIKQKKKQLVEVPALVDSQTASLYGNRSKLNVAEASEADRKKVYDLIRDTVQDVSVAQLGRDTVAMNVTLKDNSEVYHVYQRKSTMNKLFVHYVYTQEAGSGVADSIDFDDWKALVLNYMSFDWEEGEAVLHDDIPTQTEFEVVTEPVEGGYVVGFEDAY